MSPTPTSEAWTQIRYDYEHTARPIETICAEHGISSGTLRDRMRRWGWTRRRPPISAEGPPPLPAPRVATVPPPLAAVRVFDAAALSALRRDSPHPAVLRDSDPPRAEPAPECVPAPGRAHARPGWEDDGADPGTPGIAAAPGVAAAPGTGAGDETAPVEVDDSAIVPRLQSAVARLLPAIETIVARLGAGAMQPREIEQAGRALGTLTRTLRELNGLLNERQAAAANDPTEDEYGPKDIVAFRLELARRMDAIVAARPANAEGDATAGDTNASGDTFPSTREGSTRARRGSGHT
jgi:hypothetical protein